MVYSKKQYPCQLSLQSLLIFVFFFNVTIILQSYAVEDLSVAEYERFKKNVEQEIEELLTEEFRQKEENIRLLLSPYRIGDTVEISLIQGDRKRTITGRFQRISGGRVEIDDRWFLLNDIEKMDRERLFFGDKTQLLQPKIHKLRKQIEEEKGRKQKLLMEQRYKEAGYTKEFFKKTVKLQDRFWFLSELGNNKIRFAVRVPRDKPFAEITFTHKFSFPATFVVMLGRQPVYWSDVVSPEGNKNSVSFMIPKESVAIRSLQSNLRLWVASEKIGSWHLRPSIKRSPVTTKKQKKIIGVFRTLRSSIRSWSPRTVEYLKKRIEKAEEYQRNISGQKKLLMEQQKAEQERIAVEQKLREAEKNQREALARLKKETVEEIEKNYRWYTKETFPEQQVFTDKIMTNDKFDDIQAPSVINDKPVEKFSSWNDIPSNSRTLYGKKYRLIKVESNTGDAMFLIHYKVSFTNSNSIVMGFSPNITVGFHDRTSLSWKDSFQLPPLWAGEFHGTHEIIIGKSKYPLQEIRIEQ